MQAQEIYDTIVKHLFQQGKRSQNDRYCCYRGPDDTKCSIGAILPDELYYPEMEGNKTIKAIINENPDRFPQWMVDNLGLLSELQNAHDKNFHWEHPDNMRKALEKIAEVYKVSPSILKRVDDFEVIETKETAENV